jgi:predicted phosphodiesterase
MTTQNRIYILSDIHIGDNSPTCWYQQKYHEPYLIAALNYVLSNASVAQELILMGDLVDFWTYPPHQQPPSFQDIINVNPNILGPNGKLNEVLTALQGRVSYLNGNHDITVTQSDLDLLANPQGYSITKRDDFYYPLAPDPTILCTHGHTFTFFNAPDTLTALKMPVGHFVTRAVAYMMHNKLQPGQTVADISDDGAPGFDPIALLKTNPNHTLPQALLEYVRSQTGIPLTESVVLPDGTSITYGQAETLYDGLWKQWVAQGSAATGNAIDGELYAFKSVYADYDGTYMPWFAQSAAFQNGASLVATGHTHFPKLGLQNSLIKYVNSGFMCHAKPDGATKHFNFAIIHTDALDYHVEMVNPSPPIITDDASVPTDSIVIAPTQDFSCYIVLENNSPYDWKLLTKVLGNGHWIVPPPNVLQAGTTVTCWVQDYVGVHGTDGTVNFLSNGQSPMPLAISFDCPTGLFPNKASTTQGTLYAKSGSDQNWGAPGNVPSGGHPLFIKVVLT